MKMPKFRTFVGDFETTVYKGQEDTEVWASALVELGTEDVKIHHSIGETFEYLKGLNCNVCVYYHNLKFDGAFWLSYLMVDLQYEQAAEQTNPDDINTFAFLPLKEMKNNTFTYSISMMGQWYKILIKVKGHIIEIRDSLKLLPFSVKRIGKSFGTKHKKLDMEYEGFRYAGCEITDEEKKYIANDVLVVKEALEIMFNEGHNKLTIGSCCLSEYKTIVGKQNYEKLFPDVYQIPIDFNTYGQLTAGDWIRQSYKGGWCYLCKGKEKKLYDHGVTADVNSLYPSMMHSESGNEYPVGEPTFWHGNFIPDEALRPHRYYFIQIKTRFYLKPGYLPFIQIKHSMLYKGTEALETSDIYDRTDGKYKKYKVDFDGQVKPATVTLTLTMTDYELIKEHYELVDFEIIGGCHFRSACGIFDKYIDKYKQIKITSEGALRELAKLFLNNLYGKMASSPSSNFKVAFIKDDRSIGFYGVHEDGKKPGYIPVGSAITSYARNFTIRAAQKNYHGPDKPGFIYADTDSIHCDLKPEEVQGIKVDPVNFCCWKLEASWDKGWFVRQKTYIEHVIAKDLQPIDKPYYNVKCAGMPERCKTLFLDSVAGTYSGISVLTKEQMEEWEKMEEKEKEFVLTKRTTDDFTMGLTVPGKLLPKRIRGGVLLVETDFEMRNIL